MWSTFLFQKGDLRRNKGPLGPRGFNPAGQMPLGVKAWSQSPVAQGSDLPARTAPLVPAVCPLQSETATRLRRPQSWKPRRSAECAVGSVPLDWRGLPRPLRDMVPRPLLASLRRPPTPGSPPPGWAANALHPPLASLEHSCPTVSLFILN